MRFLTSTTFPVAVGAVARGSWKEIVLAGTKLPFPDQVPARLTKPFRVFPEGSVSISGPGSPWTPFFASFSSLSPFGPGSPFCPGRPGFSPFS